MRSILLFADRSPAMPARLETALSFARAYRGHLSVLVDTPVARFMSVDAMGGSYIAADAIRDALDEVSLDEMAHTIPVAFLPHGEHLIGARR